MDREVMNDHRRNHLIGIKKLLQRMEKNSMKIEHVALYVRGLEGAKRFFERHFNAKTDQLYHPKPACSLTSSALTKEQSWKS